MLGPTVSITRKPSATPAAAPQVRFYIFGPDTHSESSLSTLRVHLCPSLPHVFQEVCPQMRS